MIMNAFLPAVQMGSSQEPELIARTLTSYANSQVSLVGSYTFFRFSGLSIISLQNCISISPYGIGSVPDLESVYIPNCTSISNYAFMSCPKLESVYCPNCTSIGLSAFMGCFVLSDIQLPNCLWIDAQTFRACSLLSELDLNKCTSIGTLAFSLCGLQRISVNALTLVRSSAFNNARSLLSIVLPKVATISAQGFYSCYELSAVYLLSTTTNSIFSSAFQYCYNLLSLYLLGGSVRKLAAVNAFSSTPISNYTTSTGGVQGSIYVPASLYSTYSTSTNWATYAARFVSLTDAQISAIKESLGL